MSFDSVHKLFPPMDRCLALLPYQLFCEPELSQGPPPYPQPYDPDHSLLLCEQPPEVRRAVMELCRFVLKMEISPCVAPLAGATPLSSGA
jgi:hypothetical protein